ncbi:LysR family transcriptional regulator [Mesorhizobium sp. YC-39]|uniref:LysR family transcriptional regulator n=1 Tax=unclassified Mesorhizobium TaxID=325217 RepID=UPI0021E87B78|nr:MULTISPECIES: LysR family transcriptional regulator [unclassified Mesorhizobium]MCV3205692.1 LysR family transcriptional regulator [Mesorhizobium sp. YC-2]MCV3227909.1 LysR family transcriptional regulator [Mesorhizobium sp. YC-39]
MEISQVRYFLAVAKELNFTRAAEQCNVTQPALSRAIKLLEDEFGGALFHRERRFTHLTELGRMVETYLEGVFENSRQAKQIAEQYVHLKKTPLRVGIMSTIAPDEIIELIAAVRGHHPGVELHLCDSDAKSLRRRLLEGDLEAAIYALPSNVPDEEVHSLPLFQEQMVMAVHLNHRLANQRSVRVKDMSNESYIHRNNCEFAGYADAILAEQGVTVSPVYWSDRDDWTLAMIAAGLGFGFMPEHTAKHPGVVPLPITEPEFWREVNLVTVRGRRHSPAVGALVREATQKKWFGERAKALSAAE